MQSNTASTPIPVVLKVICYYLIIKSGIKVFSSLILLLGGDAVAGLAKTTGFDTVNSGGAPLELFIIVLAGITIWAAWQIMQLKKVGMYTYIGTIVLSFFGPAFLTTAYKPTLTLLTLSALPMVLLFRYWKLLK